MKCNECCTLLSWRETACPHCGHIIEQQKKTTRSTLLSKQNMDVLFNRDLPSQPSAYIYSISPSGMAIAVLFLCVFLLYHIPNAAPAIGHAAFTFSLPGIFRVKQGTIVRERAQLTNIGNIPLHWSIVVEHHDIPLSPNIQKETLLPQKRQEIVFIIDTWYLTPGRYKATFHIRSNGGNKKEHISLFVFVSGSTPPSRPTPIPTSTPSSHPTPIPTSTPSSHPTPIPTSTPSSRPTPTPQLSIPTPQPTLDIRQSSGISQK
jgi:hypothetical protein